MNASPTPSSIHRRLGWLALVASVALLALACGREEDLEEPVPLYGEAGIEYPLELWDNGVEGETVLRVRVTELGQVDSVEVTQTSGHAGLDSAAVTGARVLRFQPGRRSGKRVRMWATLPVQFSTRPSGHE